MAKEEVVGLVEVPTSNGNAHTKERARAKEMFGKEAEVKESRREIGGKAKAKE